VTGGALGSAQRWDVARAEPLGAPLEHSGPVVRVAYTRDGRNVVTVSGRRVRFWDAATGAPLSSLPDQSSAVHALAISADGAWLATGNEEGIARIWDAATQQPLGPQLIHSAAIHCVAFSPTARPSSPGVTRGSSCSGCDERPAPLAPAGASVVGLYMAYSPMGG